MIKLNFRMLHNSKNISPNCGYTPSDYHKVMSGRHSIMIFMPTRCIKNGQNINLNTLFREVLRIFWKPNKNWIEIKIVFFIKVSYCSWNDFSNSRNFCLQQFYFSLNKVFLKFVKLIIRETMLQKTWLFWNFVIYCHPKLKTLSQAICFRPTIVRYNALNVLKVS